MIMTGGKMNKIATWMAFCAVGGFLSASTFVSSTEDDGVGPTDIKIESRHRVHQNFRERVTVEMHQKIQIGDTEFFFEVTEFYPHFSIIDSTGEFTSLSNELKNPAFRIRIYDGEEYLEDTWAFFSVKVPHYSRKSYLTFDVTEFAYDGVVHGKEENKEAE
jgi:hypothetical protein